jgi:hypothetical protein
VPACARADAIEIVGGGTSPAIESRFSQKPKRQRAHREGSEL